MVYAATWYCFLTEEIILSSLALPSFLQDGMWTKDWHFNLHLLPWYFGNASDRFWSNRQKIKILLPWGSLIHEIHYIQLLIYYSGYSDLPFTHATWLTLNRGQQWHITVLSALLLIPSLLQNFKFLYHEVHRKYNFISHWGRRQNFSWLEVTSFWLPKASAAFKRYKRSV